MFDKGVIKMLRTQSLQLQQQLQQTTQNPSGRQDRTAARSGQLTQQPTQHMDA
jgi:hypothetical protein